MALTTAALFLAVGLLIALGAIGVRTALLCLVAGVATLATITALERMDPH